MLDALDVHEGHRVLEIGTGTGYNTALLAARLGIDAVTSVEIDPELAAQARTALTNTARPVTVVTGDGAAGWPESAPYDRIIATAAVRFGELPYTWVHRRPSRVHAAAAAPHSPPENVLPRHNEPKAQIGTTTLKAWRVAETFEARWAIGARVPECHWRHQPPCDGQTKHTLWLLDPANHAWVTVTYDDSPGPRTIRQHGERRLWDEVEAAYRWWAERGKPAPDQWGLTISPDRQTATLAEHTAPTR